MKQNLSVIVVLVVMTVSGCARLNSIHRSEHLPWFAGKIVHTDAKQRALLAVRKRIYESGKLVEQYWQFCTEPPPDVFSALASSLSAQGSLSESADPLSKEIAAEISGALSENAATIERTQTINILRESMYRTCERFLSGGIGPTEFIIQAARDQRVMVAVLAIEQLTGVQRSQATALTTVAKAAADGVSEASLKILDEAKKEADAAERKAIEKRQQAENTEPKDIDCETAKDSEEANHADKKAACAAAAASEANQAEVEAYFSTIMAAVENQTSLSADAKGALHTAALIGTTANEAIADRIVEIVNGANEFDEIGMTCVVIFRLVADSKLQFNETGDPLKEACLGRITAEAEADAERLTADAELFAARNELDAARLRQRTEEIEQRLRSTLMRQAEAIWSHVFVDDAVDKDRLEKLIPPSLGFVASGDMEGMLTAKSVDQFARALGRLSPNLRENIAMAAGGLE